MRNFKKVGIILPVFNAEKTVRRAIESVIAQTYPYWNLYIINDASTDNTLSIIDEFSKDPRIIILSNKINSGVSRTRNAGLDFAKQQVIGFIDSDDEWMPKKLELQMQCLMNNSSVILTEYEYVSKLKRSSVCYKGNILTVSNFVRKNYRVCFSSVLIDTKGDKKRFLNKGHEDFEFLYHYIKKSDGANIINEIMTRYYVMNDSLSSKKGKAAIWHYRILKYIFKDQFSKRVFAYFCYFFNAIMFKIKHQG